MGKGFGMKKRYRPFVHRAFIITSITMWTNVCSILTEPATSEKDYISLEVFSYLRSVEELRIILLGRGPSLPSPSPEKGHRDHS